jgi:hypothetical protein
MPMKYVALGRTTGSNVSFDDRMRTVRSHASGGRLDRCLGLTLAPFAVGEDAPDAALMVWAPDSTAIDVGALADLDRADESWDRLVAVHEHVLMSSKEHDPSAVVRLGFISRLNGITSDEFGRHWLDEHAPLVLASGPLFDRYVVNLTIDDVAGWDGFVEQQFADRASMEEHDRQVFSDKPAIAADVRTFIGGAQQFAGRIAFQWRA